MSATLPITRPSRPGGDAGIPSPSCLAELAERVAADLSHLDYPKARRWTLPRVVEGQEPLDVLVVGGGQSALTLAFALRQERIGNILVVDKAPRGREGPWTTFARMRHLRTPKAVTGPDLGIPSLTPRAWFEAKHGPDAWERITSIPRGDWNAYLLWFRDTLDLPVRNGTSVTAIEPVIVKPAGSLLRVTLSGPDGVEQRLTRKLVLATGQIGCGGLRIPAAVQALPRALYAHSAEDIDFTALAGRRVAVIGAAASAFDNAATALEAGAASVEMFIRRDTLPTINALYWMDFAGVMGHFAELPDRHRWRFNRHFESAPNPPPPTSVARCTAFANFHLRTGAAWRRATVRPTGILAETERGDHEVDFVICGTGFDPDPAGSPLLVPFADRIARWGDRFTPPPGEESGRLARFPYLGPAFEFLEREPGTAPFLRNIHNFNGSAVASMGNSAGAPGLRFSVPRLTNALVRDLFVEDADAYYADFLAFKTPEPEKAAFRSA
ncbi:cation diffusion facilitator CzcD-associated flavoprotein CzcO [Azospirillum agricola]|uniref:SidA/IucD/PvdA family monooxygenase n=1 Tax=Azospirillum agricola TaxID=1720247 RepID=UPI001AE544EA|nr:NAD(P)/FAD-dependent oxidoreductase [Azospirillum agricola]MBP2231923.1 cation diffusion facilitator CzcD-associated flavoprotein CzcO [Azospirillum agricola]